VHDVLGGVVQKFFLVFVCISIFACGLVIMVTNGRLIFSMARDRRLPGHQLLSHVPRATAGAVIWLAYELIVLIGPSAFRDAQYYVLGSLGVGLVFYVVQLITEPRAMRTEPGQEP
jgi:amino acid transporter